MYDQNLVFGAPIDLTANVTNTDTLDMGKDGYDDRLTNTGSRMTVDALMRDVAGGSALVVTVQGTNLKNPAAADWVDIGKNRIPVKAVGEYIGTAVSPNKFRFLRVSFVKQGTFTAGEIEFAINTFVGK